MRRKGRCSLFSSRATPAAWLSPDTSPATKRISRTRSRCRCRAFDVLDDLQRHGECVAPLFATDCHGCFATDGSEEAFEFEAQWLTFLRYQRHTLHKLLEGEWRG